ncbi:MAG: LuxR family transcriptional regulator, partial [Conexibacter sp.]|nr:LuxR family transcriptional regulator [Conexibacter sp.]
YEEAFANLARCFHRSDAAHHHREQFGAVGFLADAAALTGRQAEAREIVARLGELVAASAAPGLVAGIDYARPLLSTDERAEEEFVRALGAGAPRSPFDRARQNLFYGMWLRRQRRVIESRGPLRLARDAFDVIDAPTWSARASQELRAAGVTHGARPDKAWDDLSSQELQIAQMAAAGMSNREIGQRLYLSHRTIASHLNRIFPKLGITSRSQLNSVLPGRSRASVG